MNATSEIHQKTFIDCQNIYLKQKIKTKNKRVSTPAQLEHLAKIREKALQKKKQLKEITLKAKLAKTVPKEDLAKQYDEYVSKKVAQAPEIKPQAAKKVVQTK